jgi:hypothetical protein
MMPFYDDDTRMLYLTGKGDGNIRYFEFVDEAPSVYFLSEHRTNVSTKGADMLAKRTCNAMKCEVARMLKLTGDSVEPISFVVPRKSESFQEDIFPDAIAGKPALEANAWLSGENKAPLRVSMDPSKNGALTAQSDYKPTAVPTQNHASAAAPAPAPAPVRVASLPAASPASHATSASESVSGGDSDARVAELTSKMALLNKQLAEAKERIAELEASEAKLKRAVAALTA